VIRELVHININVADIRRSLDFYQKLGFEVMHVFGELPEAGRPARGMRVADGEVCGAVISLGDHPRCATKIELLQWLSPGSRAAAPAARGIRELGVARIAMRTVKLLAFCDELRRKGFEFELEPVDIDVVGARRFALFRDPDGTLLELVEF
jgi:catechol 2,3-dioxygenase-like lactoylglutathione lyase family enzyme